MKNRNLKLESLKSVELLNAEGLKTINGGVGEAASQKNDSTQYDSKKRDTFPAPIEK